MPPLILMHMIWGALDITRMMHDALDVSKVDTAALFSLGRYDDFLLYDAVMCFGTIPLDFLIFCSAAAGPILEPRRCQGCLQLMLVTRIVLSGVIILNYIILIGPAVRATVHYVHWRRGDLAHIADDLTEKDWAVLLLLLVTASRALFYAGAVLVGMLLTLSPKAWTSFGAAGIRTVLWMIGVRQGIVQSMITILSVDLAGDSSLEEASPTDWAFGLLLVAGSQGQWPLVYDPDQPKVDLEDGWIKGVRCRRKKTDGRLEVSPHVKRACAMSGIDRPLVPFDPESLADQHVFWDVVRLMPYASGIYGQIWGLSCIKDAVYPGTHVPTLGRCCSALCYSLSCCGASCSLLSWLRRLGCCSCCFWCCGEPAGTTEGDCSCAFNEDALLRSVEAGSRRFPGMATPTLLFASWKNLGVATSPPFAVFADHARKELIVTVRGTADIKDCIADAGARPLFFDPFGRAGKDANRSEPFDCNNDWYVHGTMLLCMEDTLHRLRHKRILEDALEGDCRGYDIVVTGHSLGAGVACLLALQMKANFMDIAHVRFVGFETPGGLLCKQLSEETQRLEWLTVACAFDWVPRISIGNVQRIKTSAFNLMKGCSRSKLQITMLLVAAFLRGRRWLCCFRRPLAWLFEHLGGGALTYDTLPRTAPDSEEKALLPLEAKGEETRTLKEMDMPAQRGRRTFQELWPGGDILYLVPTEDDTYCCRFLERNPHWTAIWADPRDLNELILSMRAVELHVPWIYEDALNKVADHFGEYEDMARLAKHNTAHSRLESGSVCRGSSHTRSRAQLV